jgi:hypothetical protein
MGGFRGDTSGGPQVPFAIGTDVSASVVGSENSNALLAPGRRSSPEPTRARGARGVVVVRTDTRDTCDTRATRGAVCRCEARVRDDDAFEYVS